MPSKTEVYEAIEQGATTNSEMADCDAVNSGNRKNIARDTKRLFESGDLNRESRGGTYHFSIPKNAETAPATDVGGDETADDGTKRMPVVRDYDWDEWVESPDDVGPYYEVKGEWSYITSMVDARMKGAETKHRLDGPTGVAKTRMARRMAADYDAPCFIFQCSGGTAPNEVYGSPTVGGEGDSWWIDSTVIKALLASRDRLTFLVLDEFNRAPQDVHNTLLDALDDRCSVRLEGPRGGEVIAGNPDNLVVFTTMNVGREYNTHPVDPATKSRISQGGAFELDYLGRAKPDKESQLLIEQAGLPAQVADMFVDVANQTRDLADDRDSDLGRGIPTRDLIAWAEAAVHLSDAGLDDALVQTGEQQIVTGIWSARDVDARQTVRNIIESTFSGVGIGDFEDGSDDRVRLACRDCSWGAWEDDAPDVATDWFECPDCGGALKET